MQQRRAQEVVRLDVLTRTAAAIGEPLDSGVVASLPRPGGNVTGFSAFVTELAGKRVELFKEAMPTGDRRRPSGRNTEPRHTAPTPPTPTQPQPLTGSTLVLTILQPQRLIRT
jgi:hypothetical protein